MIAAATSLPRREAEVCALVARGEMAARIGFRLGISSRTVESYIRRAAARLKLSHPEIGNGTQRQIILRFWIETDAFRTDYAVGAQSSRLGEPAQTP